MKTKIGKIVYWIFPILCIAVIAVSAYRFIPEYLEYKEGEEGYESLTSETIQVEDEMVTLTGKSGNHESKAQSSSDEEKETVVISVPEMEIDYEQLEQVNPDFIGVLYIPSLDLLYPFAHSKDNQEYLNRTFYGERNSAGSIFLDRFSAADLQDRNTFILGHNMKNGTMFGSLKKFASDESLCATDPYLYIYTKDAVRKYEIFSYYQVSTQSALYDVATDYESDEGYDAFIEKAKENSLYTPADLGVDLKDRPNTVTLSTCWGVGHVYNFVVHAALLGIAAN